jgi:hypothetical protein
MKRIWSILIFCLLTLSTIASKEKPDSSLVAYYPFNGNATDQSGNGNDAVVDGAVLTTDRFGKEDGAYSFDGVKSTISALVKNFPALNAPQTISWWFFVEARPVFTYATDSENMIVICNPEAGIGVQVGFRCENYKTKGFDTWNWGGGTLLQFDPPELNKWTHCVYTYDGMTHRFFLNGKELGSSTAKTQDGIPTQIMLGNYPTGNQFLKGKLDDIRIYNRELKNSEIDKLYKF